MGLDMYLEKRTYVKNWEHMKDDEKHMITITKDGEPTDIKPERVSEIVEEVGYWRKANAIHSWFVKNVQDGEDDCKDYFVSEEDIKKLVDVCKQVIEASELIDGKIKNGSSLINGAWVDNMIDGKYIKDPTVAHRLLPTTKGFFFGNTDYDEYYYQDIKNTYAILSELLKEGGNGDIYYSSSW